MTNDEADEVVQQYVTQLSEHFEAVTILCSRPSDKDGKLTHSVFRGSGNFFARIGMVWEWLEERKANEIAVQHKEANS